MPFINKFGGGSRRSFGIGLNKVPNAPTGLSVSSTTTTTATIAFTAPTNDGGTPITNYEFSTNGSTWTALSPADAITPVTVTGLTANTAYTLYLRAVNAVGAGTASSGVAATTPQAKPTSFEYLVIAGGGGATRRGGGGGAGGYRTSVSGATSGANSSAESPLSVSGGDVLTVTIGAGGGANGDVGFAGNDSVLGAVTSIKGGAGGGGGVGDNTGGAGGSGGGGGAYELGSSYPGGAGTANQGRSGGTSNGMTYSLTASGGGGGGASGVGSNAGGNTGGNGGAGLSNSITGTPVTRGGGGGGGIDGREGGTFGTGGSGGGGTNGNGTANTGGGGGATSVSGGGTGSGGSGIVILRYSNTFADLSSVSAGLTYTLSNTGGYKIYSFTAGTGTITV